MRDKMQGPRYRGRMQANRFTILLAVGLVACGLEDTDPVADGTETSGTTVEPHPQDLAPEPQAEPACEQPCCETWDPRTGHCTGASGIGPGGSCEGTILACVGCWTGATDCYGSPSQGTTQCCTD